MSFIRIITSGAVVNFFIVIIGSALGLLLKKGIPEKIRKTLMHGVALCVLYIGVTGVFEKDINPLIVILSLGLGAVVGEMIDLDRAVNALGKSIENKLNKNSESHIAEGFVSATLLFCVGAMTIVGSIDSGISGDNTTLYSKSLIDGITAIVLTSSLGLGVILSSGSVLVIEGVLTLLALVIKDYLSAEIISNMSVIGSLLIIAISFNMLKITKIKVMNLVPAILLPILLCVIF